MIFNNTLVQTRHNKIIGQPYNNPRGGLLRLIHQNYIFLGNISKIPTSIDISSYLQIIKITNHLLQSHYFLHIYMPTHVKDIPYIQTIQNMIFNHIPNDIHILLGDFNRDIALIGKHNRQIRTNPTQQDIQWKQLTNSLHLEYILTNTNYTHQGKDNYIHTSLIDGFYISTPHSTLIPYQAKPNINQQFNSDYHRITLNIPPPNTLISRTHIPITNTKY
jgi:hypothetical protein